MKRAMGALGLTAGAIAAAMTLAVSNSVRADDASDIQALKARVAELEQKENTNWLSKERADQIKALVKDVLADAKAHSGTTDVQAGYGKDGFFLQTADGNNKLVVGGFIQVRYTFDQHNANLKGGASTTSDGFEIRRARINFSGNVGNPDITYKFEGDFYGGSYVTSTPLTNGTAANTAQSGAFTVTDAFIGYRMSDQLKFKAGSFKTPFAKAELVSDFYQGMLERPEVLSPFDPVRSLGLSVYGDIVKDKWSYDVNVNDGAKSNVFRQEDVTGTTPNLDNRLAFYGRMQYAGMGKISDFNDEPDLRKANRDFVWMLGVAGGYESQSGNATPSPQTSLAVQGLSNTVTPGYANATVNGDLFRATADWSAKYEGWAIQSAVYFQQLNQAVALPQLTNGAASEFEYGGYGQVGYLILPKLELVGRVGILTSEHGPNTAEYYTAGANYYIFGHNAKIGTDVSYSPDAAYTDTSNSTGTISNTSDILWRVQFQVKF